MTTTTTPVELKVLMNHIYELHKGVRHMVLFTCNKKYSEQTIKRLESQGIPVQDDTRIEAWIAAISSDL